MTNTKSKLMKEIEFKKPNPLEDAWWQQGYDSGYDWAIKMLRAERGIGHHNLHDRQVILDCINLLEECKDDK